MDITRMLIPANGKEIIYEVTDAISEKHYVFPKLMGGHLQKAKDIIVGADKNFEDGGFFTAYEKAERTSEKIELNGEKVVFAKPQVIDMPADIMVAIKIIIDFENVNIGKDIPEEDVPEEYLDAKSTVTHYFLQ